MKMNHTKKEDNKTELKATCSYGGSYRLMDGYHGDVCWYNLSFYSVRHTGNTDEERITGNSSSIENSYQAPAQAHTHRKYKLMIQTYTT